MKGAREVYAGKPRDKSTLSSRWVIDPFQFSSADVALQ